MNAPLLNDIPPPSNSFVLRKHKIVYIPVTKVACTSLRWMVADLAGENFRRFYRASGAHQSRLMTVHSDRSKWQFAPQIKNVPPDELAEISRDNGWFIFAAVRDPWTRLWSAWQSKFLVHHTPYVREFSNEAWFPRVPAKPSDILDDWAAFVEAAPWETHETLKNDRHFMTQFASVRPRGVNYTRVYDLGDISSLFADLHTHLRGLGLDQELYSPRANENPVAMTSQALENGIDELIRDAYERDFAEWGDRWDTGRIKLAPEPLGMEAVRAIASHASANERIGDLSRELKQSQRAVADLRKKLAKAQSRPAPVAVASKPAAPPPPAAPADKLRGIADRARQRVKQQLDDRKAR